LTIEVSRRQLMASMGGIVLGSFALPSALRKALDNAPASVLSHRSKTRPISEIEHVVVLMQENRSFDHYFGAMPGVRGFGDAAKRIQELYLAGHKNEAIASVPDEWVDLKSLVGPLARIRERYRAWEDSGADSLSVRSRQPEAIEVMAKAARLN